MTLPGPIAFVAAAGYNPEAMREGHIGSTAGRLALAALLIAASVVACRSPSDPAWERVRDSGLLRVGMDASFPPFEFVAADGSLAGFDVDLARGLSARLGVEPQFVANLPYDGLYDALMAQRVDVVLSALVVNPARTADVTYSAPYFDAGPILVVRHEEHVVRSVTDLDGHSLAVALGTLGDREARSWARRSGALSVLPYPTAAEALGALGAGDADAALVDHVSALEAMGEGGALSVVGEPIVAVPYAVGMRKDSQHLLRAVNSALAGMEEDGTLDDLITRWLKGQP